MNVIVRDLIGKKVLAAVSGGEDSVALLHYLAVNRELLKLKSLTAVNVEHGIREEESKSDSRFTADFCKGLNVECLLYTVDAPKYADKRGIGLEQAARELRYDCFNKAMQRLGCDVLVTAHHKNDSVETVLFNLFRGASLKGVSGIGYKNGCIIRPLIETDKEEISGYTELNNLKFVTDSTNFDTKYRRNFLRHKLLPMIASEFDGALGNLFRFSKTAAEDDEYLTEIAQRYVIIDKNEAKITFCTAKPIFYRAVILALNGLGIYKDYSLKNLQSAYALQELVSGSEADIGGGIKAVNDYGSIVLFDSESARQCDAETAFKAGVTSFNGYLIAIEKKEPGAPDAKTERKDLLTFDMAKLPDGTVIRTRKEGDIFKKFGGGSKKLNDFFIDKKLSKRKRDSLPVAACGNEVYIVFGMEISDRIRVESGCTAVYTAAITEDKSE